MTAHSVTKPEHPVFINIMHSVQKYAQNLKLQ